jgi:acyl-CoA synthetase (AMP-forming)/AMP-acid ligase II
MAWRNQPLRFLSATFLSPSARYDFIAHLQAFDVRFPHSKPDKDVRSRLLRGVPLPGHEMVVRDEMGSVLRDRAIGQYFVKGPSLMSGHYHNAQATRCGDCLMDFGPRAIWVTADGEIVITGRAKT